MLYRAFPAAFFAAQDTKSLSRPNFSLQLTAGRSLGRQPSCLRRPERHGVTPLAGAARRLDVSCGKRRAALPLGTRGLAAAE